MRILNPLMFCFLLSLFSCKKELEPEIKKNEVFNIETFRTSEMTDDEVIQKACDSVPENSILQFNDKTYNIEHTIFVTKSLQFRGPATLRRENQIEYKLAMPATSSSRQLTLNTAKGLKVRDYFLMTNGAKDGKNTTSMNLITSIDGNVITTYYPIGNFINGSSDYPAGTNLYKDIKFFWITDKNAGTFPTQACSYADLTFDGNRFNNQGSFSWLLNYSIFASSKGKTKIDNCVFMNSPAETVVGHNLFITGSTFKNLNGSAIHTAIDRLYVEESEIHSEFSNNVFEHTNEIKSSVGGHSEGCITHSNSGGYYTATNNSFIDVGEAVLGLMYPSVSQNDWGTSNIIFTQNTISTPGRLIYSFGISSGKLENVRIIDNKIYKLNPWDWSHLSDIYPDVIIDNQVNEIP